MSAGHAVVVADTAELDRADWLALRQQGIGGSDVSAIVGLSPYRTPLSVWLEKTGIYVPEDQPSEAMEWGNILEPVVADEFSRRSGVPTEPIRQMLGHPEIGFMRADLDRLIPPHRTVTTAGVYEGKSTSVWQRKEWGTDADPKVPDHAALQTHHYLGVTGLPYAYVAVLIGGQNLVWRRVERDDDLIDRLIVLEREFWKLVENQDPPAPTERDAELLGDVWTPAPDTALTVTDELREALEERTEAKRREKQAKVDAARAQARIELALQDREFLIDGDGRVLASWRQVPPAQVAAYERAGFRRFIASKNKETV